MKKDNKKSKVTIDDELEKLQQIRSLHDGENTFVAETVIFTSSDSSGFSGAFSCLTVKDIEGKTFTIAMPNGFVEKLTAKGLNHLLNNQPVEKNKRNLEEFKKDFRLYFDHQASDEKIKEIYNSADLPICFVASNLHLSDLKDDYELSAGNLID